MFYKHWKKMALALTALFWNSCENAPISVNSNGTNSSSSAAESSSSFVQPVPAYGVVAVPCYEDGKGVKMSAGVTETKLVCDDGVFCKEREVIKESGSEPCSISDEGDLKGAVACPDYGVVYVTEKTYDCDGVTYNEAEFRERYEKAKIVKIDKKIEDRLNSEKNED